MSDMPRRKSDNGPSSDPLTAANNGDYCWSCGVEFGEEHKDDCEADPVCE